jgi:hypothetical protein
VVLLPAPVILFPPRRYKVQRAPRPLPLTLILILTLPVWSRHSCPLILTFKFRIRVYLQAYRKPATTVEERRFSAA